MRSRCIVEMMMNTRILEWFRQAEYDIETAEAMFDSKRYIYTVFMCHLSLEKALKGLLHKTTGEIPSKTHSLVFLSEKVDLELSENTKDFIAMLNRVSVPTRYPDNLQRMLKVFDENRTKEILQKSREVLEWLKGKL